MVFLKELAFKEIVHTAPQKHNAGNSYSGAKAINSQARKPNEYFFYS